MTTPLDPNERRHPKRKCANCPAIGHWTRDMCAACHWVDHPKTKANSRVKALKRYWTEKNRAIGYGHCTADAPDRFDRCLTGSTIDRDCWDNSLNLCRI